MKSQLTSDKFVMSFSVMCLIHCLFAPSLIILSYSSLALTFENIGIGGLTILISALLVEDNIGSNAQTVLTMIGSLMVIFCHYRNYKICKKVNCECHKVSSA